VDRRSPSAYRSPMPRRTRRSKRSQTVVPPRKAPRRPRIELLRQVLVPAFISGHEFVILYVHSGAISFNADIANHFHDHRKEAWWLGSINQALCPDGWGEKYVRAVWQGSEQTLSPRVPDGYYLFVKGEAVAYHSGKAKPVVDDGPPLVNNLLWIIGAGVLSTFAQMQADLFQGGKDAVEHFERVLNATPDATPPPTTGLQASARDPYEVLGLARTPSLTSAALKAACHRTVKSAHPDHWDDKHPMLVELANALTREATEAYNQIRAERGLP
jgi:hypothetical protein